MTAIPLKHVTLSCSEVKSLFEKAIVEDGVSLTEQGHIDDHLKQCAACQRIFKLKSVLPLIARAADDERFESVRATLMENVRRDRERRHNTDAQWKRFAMVGSIAILTVVGAWYLNRFLSDASQPGGSETLSAYNNTCTPSTPVEKAPGVYLVYCNGDEPVVTLENDELRVALTRGSLGMFVDPGRPMKKRVSVNTELGSVRVKGTLFSVSADGVEYARVYVVRGLVEVIPAGNEALSFHVGRDYGADIETGRSFKLSDTSGNAMRQALYAMEANGSADDIPEEFRAQNIPLDTGRTLDGGDNDGFGEPFDQADSVEREVSRTIRHCHDSPVASSIEKRMKRARRCLLARNWQCAASHYQDVLRLNSGCPGMTTVLISLAKIERRHLKHPRKALAHYKKYLWKEPNGPLEEEAFIGMADCYRRLGLKKRELETLRRYLEKFPESNLSNTARLRLEKLVGSKVL